MSYDPESYRQFIQSMPRPPTPRCSYRGCDQPKLKHSMLLCALHEMAWIAKDGTPTGKLDSLRAGDVIRWAKGIQT